MRQVNGRSFQLRLGNEITQEKPREGKGTKKRLDIEQKDHRLGKKR